MRGFISLAIFVVLAAFLRPSPLSAKQDPAVVIDGPTVVAFFSPESHSKDRADDNEALADFQFYAAKARKPLKDAGIAFVEIYASSFRVQRRSRTTTFRPGKVKVGYYFVAPNKEPHVEYGVMTDTDIIQFAENYIGRNGASAAAPSECCLQEKIWPNLTLIQDTRIRGRLSDESGEPLRYSQIELRRFVSECEQVTLKKLATNVHGNFDLGVVKQGSYRVLLSPQRGFKQPAKLECRQKNCTLDTVLMVNPTDMPGAGCPIR